VQFVFLVDILTCSKAIFPTPHSVLLGTHAQLSAHPHSHVCHMNRSPFSQLLNPLVFSFLLAMISIGDTVYTKLTTAVGLSILKQSLLKFFKALAMAYGV
jgi:hypothetical protein